MISVSKVRFTRKLACKWEKGLGTRPNMSCKVSSGYLFCNDRSEAQTEVGRGPHEIRMFGRIVGAQSALQDIQWMSALQRPQWNEDTIRDITFDTQTIVI